MATGSDGIKGNKIIELAVVMSPDSAHNCGEEVIDGDVQVMVIKIVLIQFETHN